MIDTAAAESMIMQVTDTGVHSVKLGAVGDVCLTDNEEDEEEEEEETEDDINVLNRNIQSMVSEMSDWRTAGTQGWNKVLKASVARSDVIKGCFIAVGLCYV